MGWSPKDNREKLSIEQIIKLFSLKGIVKTGAVFNIQKLNWLNGEYIREKPLGELTDFVAGFLVKRNIIDEDYNRQWLEGVVKSFQTRFCNIDEFIEKSDFLFHEDIVLNKQAKDQYLGSRKQIDNIVHLKKRLEALDCFELEAIERVVKELAEELGIKAADIIHPARVALTGASAAPGIYEVIYLVGKNRVINRLESAIADSSQYLNQSE
jgi:glutamyl/glutaminyl-tRNA synthetase